MTTQEIISSKFFITKPRGYSPCILGNNRYGLRPSAYSTLPNCVGYVVGMFNINANEKRCNLLGNWQPSYFITGAKKQNLRVEDKPVIGAVAVWEKHVAIVTNVYDKYFTVTESSYNYKVNPIIRNKSYKYSSDIKFIYPPDTETYYTVKSGDNLTKIAKKFGTTVNAIVKLNPDKIKNPNVIKTGWVLRVK